MPVLTVTQALTLIALAAEAAKSKSESPEDPFLNYVSALVTEGPRSDDRRKALEDYVVKKNVGAHLFSKWSIEEILKEAE